MYLAAVAVLGTAVAAPLADAEGRELVLAAMDVDAVVEAGVAVVDVTQVFHNPYDVAIDAVYTFPLPPDAAVRGMTLSCRGRDLVAEVRDKDAARLSFDAARLEGRTAALLEQARDNAFVQHVGGLCPGEDVVVSLQYVEQLQVLDGATTFSFPTSLGERYGETPGFVPPPLVAFGEPDLDVHLRIDEGVPLDSLWSDTHDFVVETEAGWGAEVSLGQLATRDRDFQLSWTVAGNRPRVSALVDDDGYLALTIHPQVVEDVALQRGRELVFVMDSSCSMRGTPWEATVRAVQFALERLGPDDTFDVVRFGSASSAAFGELVPAHPENVAIALESLAFDGGGTNMVAGITQALTLPGDPRRMRLVLLMTDGYIGEQLVMRAIEENLGDARVFSLGVGSAVNHLLLDQAAWVGRGVATYQLPGTPMDETIDRFYERIAHPAMTDIAVDWGTLAVEDQVPARVPDAWSGQPVRVAARVSGAGRHLVTVHGLVEGRRHAVRVPVDLDGATTHEGVRTLWARRRIGELQWAGDATLGLQLALEHHLVSPWTSLIAEDRVPSQCGAGAGNPTGVVPNVRPSGTILAAYSPQIDFHAAAVGSAAAIEGEALRPDFTSLDRREAHHTPLIALPDSFESPCILCRIVAETDELDVAGGPPMRRGALDAEAEVRARGLSRCWTEPFELYLSVSKGRVVELLVDSDDAQVRACAGRQVWKWRFEPDASGEAHVTLR